MKIENTSEANSVTFKQGTMSKIEFGSESSPAMISDVTIDQLSKKFFEALQPNSNMVLYVAGNADSIKSKLKFSGFIVSTNEKGGIVAKKPDYKLGASVSLNLKKRPTVPVNNDDDELIDEDDLLDESDLIKPTPESLQKPGSCETKKKACKDCSCGRAEQEKNPVKLSDLSDNNVSALPKSSCGSCYLGDAFRCDGCPYRGTPAFKAGEKVSLALNDDI